MLFYVFKNRVLFNERSIIYIITHVYIACNEHSQYYSNVMCVQQVSLTVFMHHYRWIVNFMSFYDKQQDIDDTSTLLTDDDLLRVNFTRPIISTDEAQDTNLNACKYLIWAYGGTVESFEYPKFTLQNLPRAFGTFNGQICLQYCGGILCQFNANFYNFISITISQCFYYNEFQYTYFFTIISNTFSCY